MKILFYLLTVICGLFGLLSLLRFFEVALLGGGIFPIQLIIGVGGIILAWVCLKKARLS